MRIPSGVTDQYIYFVAVDATDFTTRETALSSFTVYRSRNGGAASAMTTPTINETDVTNMPGVYELLLDEDMTIDSGDDSQEMVFHITHAGMAPVTRVIEVYRPKITAGNTLDVTATGAAGIDWANVENPTTAVDLSGTDIQLCDTVTTNTDMRGTDSAATAAELAKVPKSDGTTSWNATALAAINAEADTAITDAALATAANLANAQADLDTITDTGVTCVALTTAAITDVWATDALTEAYAADGAEPTPAQALYLIMQHLSESSIVSTTKTVKKLDGSTSAATFTLDDATTPTSITRAT